MNPVELSLPLPGWALVQNSPARRVPSHGTDLFATTYAIDLVPVDETGRSASRGVAALLGTEPPERFVGFGMPVLAPCAGVIAAVHDGEPDHAARRSVFALVPYALGQAARVRGGAGAIAGNHVVVRMPDGAYVLIAHLRRDSVLIRAGDAVSAGQPLGACGNSGNSTEPHVHLQAMTDADATLARGIPLRFVDYVERARAGGEPRVGTGLPEEGVLVKRAGLR